MKSKPTRAPLPSAPNRDWARCRSREGGPEVGRGTSLPVALPATAHPRYGPGTTVRRYGASPRRRGVPSRASTAHWALGVLASWRPSRRRLVAPDFEVDPGRPLGRSGLDFGPVGALGCFGCAKDGGGKQTGTRYQVRGRPAALIGPNSKLSWTRVGRLELGQASVYRVLRTCSRWGLGTSDCQQVIRQEANRAGARVLTRAAVLEPHQHHFAVAKAEYE